MSEQATAQHEPAIEKNVVTVMSVVFRYGLRTAELCPVQALWAGIAPAYPTQLSGPCFPSE